MVVRARLIVDTHVHSQRHAAKFKKRGVKGDFKTLSKEMRLMETYVNSPRLLYPSLQARFRPNIFFAGQITGVEGYLGNIATGLLAGCNAARFIEGLQLLVLPNTTILGALCSYISSSDPVRFQPMKANFGIIPPLEDGERRNRRQRARAYADRSSHSLSEFIKHHIH